MEKKINGTEFEKEYIRIYSIKIIYTHTHTHIYIYVYMYVC